MLQFHKWEFWVLVVYVLELEPFVQWIISEATQILIPADSWQLFCCGDCGHHWEGQPDVKEEEGQAAILAKQ